MIRHTGGVLCIFIAIAIVSSCGDDSTSPENSDSDPVNVTGTWHGTWVSTDAGSSGPFLVVFVQEGTSLSGTIDIPDINFHDAPLSGTVNENQFTFGDVDEVIQFSGTVGSDTANASGTYQYPAVNDEGTWTMTRGTGSFISLADSFAIPATYFGSDITWADSRIWVIAPNDRIHTYNPQTDHLDSVVAPGSYPQGIAFNGTDVLVGDGNWATSRIHKVDPHNPSVLLAPNDGSIRGIASDGSVLWCLDDDPYEPRVYQINGEGEIMGSFACLGSTVQGLAFDGTDLWYGSFSFESGNAFIHHVETNGTLLSSFEAPSFTPGGLTFDGESLWFTGGSGGQVYELDTSGTVLSAFDPPDDNGQDLAWDGAHLWFACGDITPGDNLIYRMDRTGNVLDSIGCPGNNPGGLTYDGTHLWNADNQNKRIYRLDPNGNNYYSLPPFYFQHLTYDGSQFWANDTDQNQISRFDEMGAVTASFAYPCEEIGGLTWMDNSLWVFGSDWFSLSAIYRMNTDGTIVAQYDSFGELPEPSGATNDGNSLWYLGREQFDVSFKLYKVTIAE